jgi:hypothetical protein
MDVKYLLFIVLALSAFAWQGCAHKISDQEKLDFLKKEFFYGMSYEEFMAVTPNLQNLHRGDQIIDTNNHPGFDYEWFFYREDKEFILYGPTITYKNFQVSCYLKYSDKDFIDFYKLFNRLFKKPSKGDSQSGYIWEQGKLIISLSKLPENKLGLVIRARN